ncbi:MAG: hypothetical protein JNM52_05125 [Betaproteobacteria bacterium]|nr:hypothetical protein [Betaproteobacteria bacterium]
MKSLLIKSHLAEQAKLEKMQVIDNPAELVKVSGGRAGVPDCEISYETVSIPMFDPSLTGFGIITYERPYDEVCVTVLDD